MVGKSQRPRGTRETQASAKGYPPPRVFLSKSAQAIENTGWECEKESQESLRVRKYKEVKEIEEEKVERRDW